MYATMKESNIMPCVNNSSTSFKTVYYN